MSRAKRHYYRHESTAAQKFTLQADNSAAFGHLTAWYTDPSRGEYVVIRIYIFILVSTLLFSYRYLSQAHISLNGRGANNNNSNDEATESSNQQAQPDNAESANPPRTNTEQESSQERESDNTQPQAERPQQEQGQSPFGTFHITIRSSDTPDKCVGVYITISGTVFNLPNNVEVLMEVSSESNIDGGSGNEQNTAGESNNGSNTRKLIASYYALRL